MHSINTHPLSAHWVIGYADIHQRISISILTEAELVFDVIHSGSVLESKVLYIAGAKPSYVSAAVRVRVLFSAWGRGADLNLFASELCVRLYVFGPANQIVIVLFSIAYQCYFGCESASSRENLSMGFATR